MSYIRTFNEKIFREKVNVINLSNPNYHALLPTIIGHINKII